MKAEAEDDGTERSGKRLGMIGHVQLNVFDADGVLGARGLLMGRTAGQASRGHLERGRWEGRCGRRPGREEGLA